MNSPGNGAGRAGDYIVLGSQREKIRQYGNAVTPPVAEVLVSALVEAITGQTPCEPAEVPRVRRSWPRRLGGRGRGREPRRRQYAWVLPDDGIIDPVAVEIAASGSGRVALTRAKGQLAAERILATGGTPYVITERLRVSGTTALTLPAYCGCANQESSS